MAFDGNGNWVSDFSAVADRDADIKILATRFDGILLADISASFENCLTKDGQIKPAQNFNVNNYRVVNVADPVNNKDAVNLEYLTTNLTAFLSGNNTWSGNNVFSGDNTFSGTTTGVTPAVSDNSTKLATTAWVIGYLGNSTNKASIVSWGMPDYSSGVSFASGSTTSSNGFLKLRFHETAKATVNVDGVKVYDHGWGGGDYGSQYQVSYLPVAKGALVTYSSMESVVFYPCIGG